MSTSSRSGSTQSLSRSASVGSHSHQPAAPSYQPSGSFYSPASAPVPQPSTPPLQAGTSYFGHNFSSPFGPAATPNPSTLLFSLGLLTLGIAFLLHSDLQLLLMPMEVDLSLQVLSLLSVGPMKVHLCKIVTPCSEATLSTVQGTHFDAILAVAARIQVACLETVLHPTAVRCTERIPPLATDMHQEACCRRTIFLLLSRQAVPLLSIKEVCSAAIAMPAVVFNLARTGVTILQLRALLRATCGPMKFPGEICVQVQASMLDYSLPPSIERTLLWTRASSCTFDRSYTELSSLRVLPTWKLCVPWKPFAFGLLSSTSFECVRLTYPMEIHHHSLPRKFLCAKFSLFVMQYLQSRKFQLKNHLK
jgi:hypothetical protein